MSIGLPLRSQGLQSLFGVLGCHLHQLMRLSLLRDKELHLLATALRTQPLTYDLRLFDLLWKHDLRRDRGGFCVELGHELFQHFSIRLVFSALQDEVFAPDQFAAANEEDLYTGFSI